MGAGEGAQAPTRSIVRHGKEGEFQVLPRESRSGGAEPPRASHIGQVWGCFGSLRSRSADPGARGGWVGVFSWSSRLRGGRTRDITLPKPAPCPLVNVFSGEFRGSQENELSERRKQEMAGELVLILSCGTQHSKGFKGYSKMLEKKKRQGHPSLFLTF